MSETFFCVNCAYCLFFFTNFFFKFLFHFFFSCLDDVSNNDVYWCCGAHCLGKKLIVNLVTLHHVWISLFYPRLQHLKCWTDIDTKFCLLCYHVPPKGEFQLKAPVLKAQGGLWIYWYRGTERNWFRNSCGGKNTFTLPCKSLNNPRCCWRSSQKVNF